MERKRLYALQMLEDRLRACMPSNGLEQSDEDRQQQDILLSLLDYTHSLRWLKHAASKRVFRYYLQNGCSYRKTANHYAITLDNLYKRIAYAQQKLSDVLEPVLQLLDEGFLNDAARAVAALQDDSGSTRIWHRGLDDLALDAVLHSSVDMSDIAMELRFLFVLSRAGLSKLLEGVDQTKLSHLLYLLESGDTRYVRERVALTRLLNGVITTDQASEVLARLQQLKQEENENDYN